MTAAGMFACASIAISRPTAASRFTQNINTATLVLAFADFERFLASRGNDVRIRRRLNRRSLPYPEPLVPGGFPLVTSPVTAVGGLVPGSRWGTALNGGAVNELVENEWVALPGGELEGRRPKTLCGPCRVRKAAGASPRAICFECFAPTVDARRQSRPLASSNRQAKPGSRTACRSNRSTCHACSG